MLRIVDDLNWQEACNGIDCKTCQFNVKGICKLSEWFSEQPKFEDKSRLIPIANITFDEDKMKEICEKAISDLIITCPNCGTEIKPRKEVDT